MSSEPTLFDIEEYAVPDRNPMLTKHGLKKGKQCSSCKFFIRQEFHDKTYFKCELRGVSRSASTDHRLKWLACGLYQEEENAE